MNKENYELLGITEDATDEEIENAYRALKEKNNELRWEYGETGTEASRMLDRLEVAYAEIMDERKQAQKNTSGASAIEEVAELIKNGDVAEAQRRLDDFNERSAEWHYLQSVVFYKKNWMNDSKKQLEIAMQMDGGNAKYREAYDKLCARAEYQEKEKKAEREPEPQDYPEEQMGGNACMDMCSTCLCANCLYSICCGCR